MFTAFLLLLAITLALTSFGLVTCGLFKWLGFGDDSEDEDDDNNNNHVASNQKCPPNSSSARMKRARMASGQSRHKARSVSKNLHPFVPGANPVPDCGPDLKASSCVKNQVSPGKHFLYLSEN